MPDRFTDDLTRTLLEQIDARLREAEQVRNRTDEGWRQRPFYPERRRVGRTTADQPREPKRPP